MGSLGHSGPSTMPAAWSSQVSPLLWRSLHEQAMPFCFLQLLLTKCIPLLCGFGCLGNCEHQAAERRFGDGKQAQCPPLPHALYLRVPLGLQESQWSHSIYMLWAFYESLVPYPETITNWEEKEGRKTRERKKNTRSSLFITSFPKILKPCKEKRVGARTVGRRNNIK